MLCFLVAALGAAQHIRASSEEPNPQTSHSALELTKASAAADLEQKNQQLERRLAALSASYLQNVEMGLLGGLNYAAYTDPTRGGTTDYIVRNQCLNRNWETGGVNDECIIKWDGYERLKRVQSLYERVKADGVAGDLVECGVWRGGITVYMKALLTADADAARNVWVVDSFEGVPDKTRQEGRAADLPKVVETSKVYAGSSLQQEFQKKPKDHPKILDEHAVVAYADENQWGGHVLESDERGHQKVKNLLTVEEGRVRANFQRFGLLDDRVKFVKGYFNDTLPTVQADYGMRQIAVLRVDGDLYSSTMDVLQNLYPLVAPGGWVILDDWPLPQAKLAIQDFLKAHGLPESVLQTDRVTPEKRPKRTVQGDALSTHGNINNEAYFQKPYASPAAHPVHRVLHEATQ